MSEIVSPVHLHVEDKTPLHLHLKKTLQKKDSKESKLKGYNVMRPTASSKAKHVKSDLWIPPPAKSTKPSKITCHGMNHRVDIVTPTHDEYTTTVHFEDFETEDEDDLKLNIRKYEKKIESLLKETGNYKNEMELQNRKNELMKMDNLLDTSLKCMEQQKNDLKDYKRDLRFTEAENKSLRSNLESVWNTGVIESSKLHNDDMDSLLKRLIEVEMDGLSVAKHCSAFSDMIFSIQSSASAQNVDVNKINTERDSFLYALQKYEKSNHELRYVMKNHSEFARESLKLKEQRDSLLQRLGDIEAQNDKLQIYIDENERSLQHYKMQLTAQNDENIVISSRNSSLESSRAHLQNDMRQKEGDCNRMAVQIRKLENSLAQDKIEIDHLCGLLDSVKEKTDKDKEALKKATRVQKERAERNQEAVENVSKEISERDKLILELQDEMHQLVSQCEKIDTVRSQFQTENVALEGRLSELSDILEKERNESKCELDKLKEFFNDKNLELSKSQSEKNQIQKNCLDSEEKLRQINHENVSLKSSLREYLTLVEDYKGKLDKVNKDNSDIIHQLSEVQTESNRIRHEKESELERVKKELQERLMEMRPLPELLKSTENKLQDATEKIMAYEKRNSESNTLMVKLTNQIENQSDHTKLVSDQLKVVQDENNVLHAKQSSFEKKLYEVESQNKELSKVYERQEETLILSNRKLDEKSKEVVDLSHKLQSIAIESHKKLKECEEKSLSKERNYHSRILELEAQLNQVRAEIAKLKREKEECERKFNSRLHDLKDQLEQSQSTNRSMQNYVQFLKGSYSSVFGNAPASKPLNMYKNVAGSLNNVHF